MGHMDVMIALEEHFCIEHDDTGCVVGLPADSFRYLNWVVLPPSWR